MNKIAILLIFPLFFIVFSLACVTAQNFTLVAGKVYLESYKNPLGGADVSVTCNNFNLKTVSKPDGTYAVGFNPGDCRKDHLVEVSASSGKAKGEDNGNVTECKNGEQCEADFFAVINVLLNSSSDGFGGAGGARRITQEITSKGFYFCGNGICDTGETPETCPKDCKSEEKKNASQNNEEKIIAEPEKNNKKSEENNNGGFSFITGAVIGALKQPPILVAAILIIAILAAALVVNLRNRKK